MNSNSKNTKSQKIQKSLKKCCFPLDTQIVEYTFQSATPKKMGQSPQIPLSITPTKFDTNQTPKSNLQALNQSRLQEITSNLQNTNMTAPNFFPEKKSNFFH